MGLAANNGTAYCGSAQALRRAGNMPHEVREQAIQGESRAPSVSRVSVYKTAEIFGATEDTLKNPTQSGRPHTNVTVTAGCGCRWTLQFCMGLRPGQLLDGDVRRVGRGNARTAQLPPRSVWRGAGCSWKSGHVHCPAHPGQRRPRRPGARAGNVARMRTSKAPSWTLRSPSGSLRGMHRAHPGGRGRSRDEPQSCKDPRPLDCRR
jgi:hypothetical protein